MNVLSVGLDLIEIDRFRVLYGDFDPEVLARCFTALEQTFVGTDADRLAHLASRFAGKEAVLKTIGGLQDGIALTEVSRSSGIPIATLVYWQSQAEQNSEEPS